MTIKQLTHTSRIAVLSIVLTMCATNLVAQITDQASYARVSEKEIQLQEKYMAAIGQQQIGKFDAAAKLFKEVLDKSPKCDGCAFQLSRLNDQLKNPQDALDFAKKAVAIDPQNKWYQMHIAEIYEKIGKDREAIEVYRKLIDANSFGTDYADELYFRLAFAQVRMSEPVKAIKTLDELEKKMGINEEISDKKHLIYDELGDKKRAAAELRRLADAFPSIAEYQHATAAYYEKIGDKMSTIQMYERILKRDPSDSKAQLALATKNTPPSVSSVSGGKDAAFLQSLKGLFAKPDISIDEKIKTILPFAQKIGERKDKPLAAAGLGLAEILERAHPNEAKAYALVADMLYHNDRLQESLVKYKRCLDLNKTIYAVWEQKMYVEEELGLFDDLLKTSNAATDLFPSQATAFYFNGLANERKGQFGVALESLEQALLMSARKPIVRSNTLSELGITLSKLKSYDKSMENFEAALKVEPLSPIALLRFANILVTRKIELERAQQMANQARKMGADQDPSVLELYGDYLFKAADREGAIELWQLAKEKGGKSIILDKKIAAKDLVE
ncbi:MAG: tetratricopeptide repeat protein [Saprospiraceae bacterium]|nr:tetratricopeptide repeat protein [Saprospiraceae bacterium]